MALFMKNEMSITNNKTIAHVFLAGAGGWIFSVVVVGILCERNLEGKYLLIH